MPVRERSAGNSPNALDNGVADHEWSIAEVVNLLESN